MLIRLLASAMAVQLMAAYASLVCMRAWHAAQVCKDSSVMYQWSMELPMQRSISGNQQLWMGLCCKACSAKPSSSSALQVT
jgi:hypothetical protein